MIENKLLDCFNRKKFLMVIGTFDHIGGSERQALIFGLYLKEKLNAKVTFLTWNDGEPIKTILKKAGIPFLVFPLKEIAPKSRRALDLFRLTRLIKKEIRPDYILPFVGIHSKIIAFIWKNTGAKYAWWNQQDEGRGLFITKNERRALLNVCDIISNSYEGQKFLSEHYDIPTKKIKVYNNGTPIPDIQKLKPVWREKLAIEPETRLVSMIANVTSYKDHKTLFYAWQKVQERFKLSGMSIKLLLAGHLKDKTTVQYLKTLGFDLNLSDSIRFLGLIDSTNELILESDLVVHSSNTEGCPNAVCEAMALGRPVVGTDISGIRQALGTNHKQYCISQSNNPQDLAEKIIRLIEDRALAEKVGNSNLERIKQVFSVEGMVVFFLKLIYEQINTNL